MGPRERHIAKSNTKAIDASLPPKNREAPVEEAPETEKEPEKRSFRDIFVRAIQCMVLFYLVKLAFGNKTAQSNNSINHQPSSTANQQTTPPGPSNSLHNFIQDGQLFDLEIYLSTLPAISPSYLARFVDPYVTDDVEQSHDASVVAKISNESSLSQATKRVYSKTIPYSWDTSDFDTEVTQFLVDDENSLFIASALRKNSTIYAHARVTLDGFSKSPESPSFRPYGSFIRSTTLTEYRAPAKYGKVKNLLSESSTSKQSGNNNDSDNVLDQTIDKENVSKLEAIDSDERYVLYWQPTALFRLVYDVTPVENYAFNRELANFYSVNPGMGFFLPPALFDSFWNIKDDNIMIDTRAFAPIQLQSLSGSEQSLSDQANHTTNSLSFPETASNHPSFCSWVNGTLPKLPLDVSYSPTTVFRLSVMLSVEKSFAIQTQKGFGGMALSDGREIEEMKRMLRDTNPWLLGLTILVSTVTMIFDYLAFSSDITFWKNKKSVAGLSIRTLFVNSVSQLVIFLYLLDNDTSWTILLSSGVGTIIEFWKISKAMEFSSISSFPYFKMENREEYSSTEVAEHDRIAFRYLTMVFIPLIIGYSIYNLVYSEYKSWYSWVLSSLSSTVYGFGFISMCPQLYLNYKLQSVAHLPWKMLTYKALNTFIDDLFAFIIKMPMLHRIACFRDDIIFFIFLFQKWKYRTDYTRVNEFDVSFEDIADNELADKEHVPLENKGDQIELVDTTTTSSSIDSADSMKKKTPLDQDQDQDQGSDSEEKDSEEKALSSIRKRIISEEFVEY